MKIQSKYSRPFYTNELSKTKLNSILELALEINSCKNELSLLVSKDLLTYLEKSKLDFQKEVLLLYKDKIGSNFIKQLSDDVFTSYQNKFDGIKRRLRFEKITFLEVTTYKRNTKKNKKGDFKGISNKKESTSLSIALTYLARYGHLGIENYLLEKFVNETDPKKEKFYANILDKIYKFGLSRLLALTSSKKERIIQKYSKRPIQFNSLFFRGRSRLSQEILSYNTNYNSKIKAFINISWLERGEVLTLPVKYSKSFHGGMKPYTNGTDTSYTICFTEDNRIRVILSKDGEREIPENKTNFEGIDLNVKYNLIQTSSGHQVDYDRKLMEVLVKELLKVDELKKKNSDYQIGKRRQKKINHLRREFKSKTRNSLSDLCKHFNSVGIDHVGFENLDNSFGKCFVKTEDGINFNRLVKELNLSSIKDEFEHIARKYDISTSTVFSYYTSQRCSNCGYIDSENRKSQEEFECLECEFEINADLNAALNIKEFLASTVLRSSLLKKTKFGNGTFEPRVLKKDKVKEVLLSLRNSKIYCKEYPDDLPIGRF